MSTTYAVNRRGAEFEADLDLAVSAIQPDDPRLIGPREWTADTVSQMEAEAGSAGERRAWTAQRIRQAFAAWWFATPESTKLSGIEDGATVNASDASLRDRGTHTGTQPANTITGLATVAVSGSYNDLSDTPIWSASAIPNLSAVALSGDYSDVIGAPPPRIDANIRDRATHTGTQPVSTITGLHAVATSGSYTSLSNTPTLGSMALANAASFATAAQGLKADTALQPSDIGSTVQPYSANYVKSTSAYTWTGEQTFTGITQTVHTLTGTNPAIDPANGAYQSWTLTANSSFTEAFQSGQSVTLMLEPNGFAVTWPSGIQWVGAAPVLPASGTAVMTFKKIGTQFFGAMAGSV